MKFYKLADARYYVKGHTKPFQARLQIVKCRHWSMEKWAYVPCYTVILN